MTRPSGAQRLYTIDPRNMLTAVTEPLSRGTAYGRDNNGNLTSVTDPNGHVTTRVSRLIALAEKHAQPLPSP